MKTLEFKNGQAEFVYTQPTQLQFPKGKATNVVLRIEYGDGERSKIFFSYDWMDGDRPADNGHFEYEGEDMGRGRFKLWTLHGSHHDDLEETMFINVPKILQPGMKLKGSFEHNYTEHLEAKGKFTLVVGEAVMASSAA